MNQVLPYPLPFACIRASLTIAQRLIESQSPVGLREGQKYEYNEFYHLPLSRQKSENCLLFLRLVFPEVMLLKFPGMSSSIIFTDLLIPESMKF